MGLALALVAGVLTTNTWAQADARRDGEAQIEVNGPLIVGFFPPVTKAEMEDPDSGAAEALAHIGFAVHDTQKCLKASGIEAKGRVVQAKVLIISDSGKTTRIKLPTSWPKAAGIYLFNSGKKPVPVYAEAGPSSLIVLAPEAAAKLYAAKTCKDPTSR